MTSTSVKDVGSVLSGLGAVGSGTKTVTGGGFQTVFNGQAGRDAAEHRTENAKPTVKKAPGDSLKAKDAHRERVKKQEPAKNADDVQEETDEIRAKKLREIMEALGTAAGDLMQQIADTFGVSMEDIENAMRELGMETADLLNRELLAELLLKVAGAEDIYALVTNGELYDNYQEMMAKLESLLQETAEELEVSPEQLEDALLKLQAGDQDDISAELMAEAADDADAMAGRLEESVNAQQSIHTAGAAEEQGVAGNVQRENESGQRESHSDRGERHGMFAQNLAAEQYQNRFDPQLQQTSSASDVWSTDTQDIMRQIMDYMRVQVKPDTTSLEMQLHPESLGTLQIQVASKGGVLTANFITQNEAVKAALESQMVQLRENFEQQGVKVEAIEVTVQSHAFERNLDQGRGQSSAQEQSPRRARTRRINLNESIEMENLEEEDALAAEMMAASGSQVDFTA